MPRTLQHITYEGRATEANKEGRKVETLCGARVYQMSQMKDEIPTCTPCARVLMAEHRDMVLKPPFSVTYHISGTGTWTSSGGAA